MAKREVEPRLQKLIDEGKNIYSISKLNCVNGCQYEAYLTYVMQYKGADGIYGILGTKIHDKLEAIVNNTAAENELLTALNEELADLDMLGIDFPKDGRGGDAIRNNWIADMTHFCANFIKPKGQFDTEEFVLYRLNENRYMQGYIDLVRHNKDGTISIYDWKTSTDFSGEHLTEAGRQLIFYAMAKEQQGYAVRDIAWIMAKYCEVSFLGKPRVDSANKTQIIKIINRGKLLRELGTYIRADLEELGCDDIEIEIMLRKAADTNSFDCLPKEITQRYTVKPYVRKYNLTDELRQETLNYINITADLFESKSDNEKEWQPREFIRVSRTGKKTDDSFKCSVLCNHRNNCAYIREYNKMKLFTKTTDADLF